MSGVECMLLKLGRSGTVSETRDADVDILEAHQHVNAREARTHFKDFIAEAQYKKNRTIVTEHGRPAAALVTIEDLRILERLRKTGVARLSDLDRYEG